ncbi:hypothetical protein [Vacuolonema iberomarrocanum]|uniref:hypothetical protein n=1 Tax=Vacuolonema iberomarrocanum TaxID=3454632 RepID=UPI001A00CC84|nr:hypothetical protein [filamentous cyanobacterium LEGE 07170]
MIRAFVPWLWLLAASADAQVEPSKLDQALEFMNGNPYLGWGIAIFAVLAMATAAIANLTGNLDKIIEFIKKHLLPGKAKITDEQRQQLLKQLNNVVLKEVSDHLNKSLHHRIQMDLECKLQMQRVGRPNTPQQSKSSS